MAYDFQSLNVLVADDSELIRELMKTILENLGVGKVTLASDGAEAIEKVTANTFDMAFIDWKMEPMDGVSFTRQMRASMRPEEQFLPIIMISGFTEEARVRQAMAAGVTEFLAKPLTAATVYSRLAWVIEHPRDYVKTGEYFGPCRRRRAQDIAHAERRVKTPKAAKK